jgi:hypothetical protein
MSNPFLFSAAAAAAVIGLTLAGGCGKPQQAADAAQAQEAPGQKSNVPTALFGDNARLVEADAVKEQQFLIHLVTYKITVPAGSISRSGEFWKHVDERAVDVPTYETLYKNGLRCGVASTDEWDYFKSILEQYPAVTQPSSATGREAKHLDMDLKQKVDYQNIFYYSAAGDLVGQTWEKCDNLLRIGFQPAPRKHGTVRLTTVPVVRSLRERLVPIGDVNTLEVKSVYPERLFDLNLTVDVPLNHFLIVAPSPDGQWPSSLGNALLVNNGEAEQSETLLIFRPQPFRHRFEPPAAAASPQPPAAATAKP